MSSNPHWAILKTFDVIDSMLIYPILSYRLKLQIVSWFEAIVLIYIINNCYEKVISPGECPLLKLVIDRHFLERSLLLTVEIAVDYRTKLNSKVRHLCPCPYFSIQYTICTSTTKPQSLLFKKKFLFSSCLSSSHCSNCPLGRIILRARSHQVLSEVTEKEKKLEAMEVWDERELVTAKEERFRMGEIRRGRRMRKIWAEKRI